MINIKERKKELEESMKNGLCSYCGCKIRATKASLAVRHGYGKGTVGHHKVCRGSGRKLFSIDPLFRWFGERHG